MLPAAPATLPAAVCFSIARRCGDLGTRKLAFLCGVPLVAPVRDAAAARVEADLDSPRLNSVLCCEVVDALGVPVVIEGGCTVACILASDEAVGRSRLLDWDRTMPTGGTGNGRGVRVGTAFPSDCEAVNA